MTDVILFIAITVLLVVAATICFQPEFFRRRPSARELKKKIGSRK